MLALRIPLSVVGEAPSVYRLIRDRFEEFALLNEERFEQSDGPLRPVVRRVVEQVLDCRLLENGFARVRCRKCGADQEWFSFAPEEANHSTGFSVKSGRSYVRVTSILRVISC
jgi:hypothetical protein